MNLPTFVRKHFGVLLFVGLALFSVLLGFANMLVVDTFSAKAVIFPAFNGMICVMMVLMLLWVTRFFFRNTPGFELAAVVFPSIMLVVQQLDNNPYTDKLEYFSVVIVNAIIGSVVGWFIYKLTKHLPKVTEVT